MKKILSLMLAFAMLLSLATPAMAADANNGKVTMYAADGRTTQVDSAKIEAYKKVGWYTEPVVKMYAADGRTKYVEKSKVEANKKVGWYDSKPVTMYSADGKTKTVGTNEIAAYKKVGWYEKRTDVYSLLYSADGRITEVLKKDVSKYTAVGWKTSFVELNVTDETKDYKYGDGILRISGPSKINRSVYVNYDIKTLYIGGNVTEIESSAFGFCDNLTRVELSNSVKKLGWSTFSNRNIKRIGIPKSVTVMDPYLAFGLTDMVIYCEKGSEAEKYAKSYGVKYVYATMIYCLDGRTMMVDDKEKAIYLASGLWAEEPVVAMYTTDGRIKAVKKADVAAYKKVGWYDNKADVMTTMYSLDGKTKQIFKGQVEAYKKVGWYDSPIVSVYAPDGRIKKIPSSQKSAHLKVGWYDVPVVKVGASDGRTKVIPSSKLGAYEKVGWKYISNVKLTITEKGKTIPYIISDTAKISTNNWANVSAIQQFKYKNEGIGYAYSLDNNVLNVVLPKKTLKIKTKYPLLGDVIADDNGNVYVVWGKENQNGNYDTETMFISKYTSSGVHVKTTGFVGECPLDEAGNTKTPFAAGNCSSAIGNGKLVVNYARRMYNGHQSNNVIGVNISDMTPIKYDSVWDIPYTSHSFNQRVIFSKHTNDFIFADHGDAYPRAFVITSKNKVYNIFNFYLQQNAGYDMLTVNKTFAQMGSLLETNKGVVLVGASAKSIGEAAKNEKQNLFVQVFNPNATKVDENMFVGGVKRSGKTSDDINDNSSKPLVDVTDYGVQWITNYTDKSVIAPHAVVAGNKIVIFWGTSRYYTTQYAILAEDGTVVVPPSDLGKDIAFNSMEDPIYHNGKIYWVAAEDNTIKVMSMSVPN